MAGQETYSTGRPAARASTTARPKASSGLDEASTSIAEVREGQVGAGGAVGDVGAFACEQDPVRHPGSLGGAAQDVLLGAAADQQQPVVGGELGEGVDQDVEAFGPRSGGRRRR